jgi:hypothetical protein
LKYARPLSLFTVGLLLTIIAGRWAMGLFTQSEFVHFSVNFPTEPGTEQASRHDVGGPWSMLSDDEWSGYPRGGLIAWGREGSINIDLGGQGILKRLIQPDDVTLSTHWLRNVGIRPYRIKLDIDMCAMPVEWETFETHWDQETRSSTREVRPGKLFNMDWRLTVPRDRRERSVVCDGGVRVMDADTEKLLTFLPIKIINSRFQDKKEQ